MLGLSRGSVTFHSVVQRLARMVREASSMAGLMEESGLMSDPWRVPEVSSSAFVCSFWQGIEVAHVINRVILPDRINRIRLIKYISWDLQQMLLLNHP